MKTKNLNAVAMLKNINGLSVGDKAYCGPYGTITCRTSKAYDGRRTFSVKGSSKLVNRGNWTMAQLRAAIEG